MTSRTRALPAAAAALAVAVAASAGAGLSHASAAAEPHRLACLASEETRQAMLTRKLVPPVRAVEAALRNAPGESVGIRLCREDAAMIYDITVLRHDGHLVHILIDAGSGVLVPPRADH